MRQEKSDTWFSQPGIPCYVDPFEEEKLIDIEEVHGNIERIKAEIAVVEAQMAQYLKELGL